MTLDIDIGGDEPDDMEEDDLVQAEEVEVEEVEVLEATPVEPPKRPPPVAVKKPSRWLKRILVVVVVVVLIIVALIAWVYFRTEVTDVNLDIDYMGNENLEVTVLMGTSGTASVAGKADLEITLDDAVIYTTKVSIDDGGNGYTTIPYTDFIEGNGNYYVQVKYQGKESPVVEYEVKYIVESMNISVDVGRVLGSGQLNLTVTPLDKNDKQMGDDPLGATIKVNEIRNLDDGSDIAPNEQFETLSESSFSKEYPAYTHAGNYTITVTIENKRLNPNSGSPYLSITKTRTMFLNIRTIADMFVNDLDNDIISYTVEFDASSSWNDGDITMYLWDFGDGETYSETADDHPDGAFDGKTTHTYSRSGTTIGADIPIGSYLATVNVKGDVVDPLTDEVEAGALTVRVDPP